MKYFHIAVTIKEGEKFYSYGIKVSESDNLLSKLKIKNIVWADIFQTKKKMEEVVKMWNDGFTKNGTSLYFNNREVKK